MTRGAAMLVTGGLALALAAPGAAVAGTIYGTIREAGRPVGGVGVELSCDGPRQSQQTDSRGTYRFTVPGTGRCQLDVEGGSAPVILYDEPTRYDFELRRGAGRPTLIRR